MPSLIEFGPVVLEKIKKGKLYYNENATANSNDGRHWTNSEVNKLRNMTLSLFSIKSTVLMETSTFFQTYDAFFMVMHFP